MGGLPALRGLASELANYGRHGDTMLAHITPQEAALLRRMGGAGTRNPYTGLPEFYDADSNGNASDSGNPGGGDNGSSSDAGGGADAGQSGYDAASAAIGYGYGPESPNWGGPPDGFDGIGAGWGGFDDTMGKTATTPDDEFGSAASAISAAISAAQAANLGPPAPQTVGIDDYGIESVPSYAVEVDPAAPQQGILGRLSDIARNLAANQIGRTALNALGTPAFAVGPVMGFGRAAVADLQGREMSDRDAFSMAMGILGGPVGIGLLGTMGLQALGLQPTPDQAAVDQAAQTANPSQGDSPSSAPPVATQAPTPSPIIAEPTKPEAATQPAPVTPAPAPVPPPPRTYSNPLLSQPTYAPPATSAVYNPAPVAVFNPATPMLSYLSSRGYQAPYFSAPRQRLDLPAPPPPMRRNEMAMFDRRPAGLARLRRYT